MLVIRVSAQLLSGWWKHGISDVQLSIR